jgi:hypothetical protein
MVKWCGERGAVSKNHSWMGVNGAGPAVGVSGTWSTAAVAVTASWATVGCRKTSLDDSRRPACRARETTWMLRMESPPSSKKLSSTPTRSTRSTSAQTRASSRSTGVVGSTWRVSGRPSGAGSARRSTFPLALNGSASSATNADGTM